MRKQTKLVAVLSAAALLAVGASITSFAAGWTEENGTWVYYDNDDELVTNEWRKSGSNYYYLNDDGEMASETWVDDEYYVDETGKMVTNTWLKLVLDDADIDDPNGDGEGWFYFDSRGKKVTDTKKTINGKVYYFDDNGLMEYGWYEDENSNYYYLGDEDDGARKSGWLWLERPDVDNDDIGLCDDDDCEECDEEGWYWFAKDGKVYTGTKQKKIDGKYYYFNNHGQMLYNWIIATKDQVNHKDDEDITPDGDIASMDYAFNVDKGWRVDGWLQVDGSYNMGMENDEDWYFFDDGDTIYADKSTANNVGALLDTDGYAMDTTDWRYRERIKKEGKWFCFDEKGRMKTGLQAIRNGSDYDVYFFDDNGFVKTGKVSNVELDNGETANFYFSTSNSKKGRGVTGEESGYLYYKGMRLEADDDYKFFGLPKDDAGNYDIYLVNENGKIQKGTSKNGKRFDPEKIENNDYAIVEESGYDDNDKIDVYVNTTSKGVVTGVRAATSSTSTASKDLKTWVNANAAKADDINDVDFGWED